MKKTLFFAYILVSIFLLGCAKEEVITQKPTKTFFVNPQSWAINVEVAGMPFNAEFGKNGWSGTASRSWEAYNGVPKYIHHHTSFLKSTGANNNIIFAISAPLIEVADPNNINGTYTYEMLRNFFKKGKQVLRDPKNKVGYDLYISYIEDASNPAAKHFGYNTLSQSQEGSTLEIVKVEEIEFANMKYIYVTYNIDCNIYKESIEKTKDRLVGTIQVGYVYEPF